MHIIDYLIMPQRESADVKCLRADCNNTEDVLGDSK